MGLVQVTGQSLCARGGSGPARGCCPLPRRHSRPRVSRGSFAQEEGRTVSAEGIRQLLSREVVWPGCRIRSQRGGAPRQRRATFSVARTRFHSSSHGQDFPGGRVDKNLPTSCRGDGFDPWCGKIPHAMKQLRPCAAAAEPACLSC